MGPRPLGPIFFYKNQHIFDGVAELLFVFMILGVPKKEMLISKKEGVFLQIFVILANIDQKLRLEIYKIAI